MNAPQPILETRGLCKSYGALQAVNDVNFALPAGELRAIIGPNGAGKSTFFSLLMGRTRPTSGDIFMGGIKTSKMAPHRISRLGVSLAFQITNIFATLTVAENLRLAAQSRGNTLRPFSDAASQPAVEARVDEVLDQIELSGKKSEIASNLSHGEQKYLEIGIALAISPSLLLLDEPTAGMSPEETRSTSELIRRLAFEISVILVEHDMDVVMGIADRISVFHNGQIIAEGAPDEIRGDSEVQRVYLRGS